MERIYITCKTPEISCSTNIQSHNLTYDHRIRFFHTFHGLLIPLKNSGIHIGRTTASLSSFLASTKSAMSSLTKGRKKKKKKKEKSCLPDSDRLQKNQSTAQNNLQLNLLLCNGSSIIQENKLDLHYSCCRLLSL